VRPIIRRKFSFSAAVGSLLFAFAAHGGKDDQGNMWLIKEPHDMSACEAGTPIKCGDVVRLEHLVSHRNLHSHLFRSALSPNQVRF
jgi:dolichyl-phosphate-mannose--protein O-mannosyl transferase